MISHQRHFKIAFWIESRSSQAEFNQIIKMFHRKEKTYMHLYDVPFTLNVMSQNRFCDNSK